MKILNFFPNWFTKSHSESSSRSSSQKTNTIFKANVIHNDLKEDGSSGDLKVNLDCSSGTIKTTYSLDFQAKKKIDSVWRSSLFGKGYKEVILSGESDEGTSVYLSRKDRNLLRELQDPTGALSDKSAIQNVTQFLSYLHRIKDPKKKLKFATGPTFPAFVRQFCSDNTIISNLLSMEYETLLLYKDEIKILEENIPRNSKRIQKNIESLNKFLECPDEGNKEKFFTEYIRTKPDITGQTTFYQKFSELKKTQSTVTWPKWNADNRDKYTLLFSRLKNNPDSLKKYTTPEQLLEILTQPETFSLRN